MCQKRLNISDYGVFWVNIIYVASNFVMFAVRSDFGSTRAVNCERREIGLSGLSNGVLGAKTSY